MGALQEFVPALYNYFELRAEAARQAAKWTPRADEALLRARLR